MAALAINKREMFAQALADNMNQEQAYVAAGFTGIKNAKTNASHLLKKDKSIKKRVAEIRNEKSTMQVRAGTLPTVKAFESLGVGKDTICEHLWDIAMQAKAAVPVLDKEGNRIGIYSANWNSSIKALELLGKEMGMFLPKDELPANEYANKSTKDIVQELVDKCAKMGIKIQVPAMQGETITIE